MSSKCTVIYNESCPICSREVAGYSRYCEARDLPLEFTGLGQTDLDEFGLNPDLAARKLHVVQNGQVFAGVPAFVALWSEMPRFRWLATIINLPGIRQFATLVYDRVLAPSLYWTHRRRQSRVGKLAARERVR